MGTGLRSAVLPLLALGLIGKTPRIIIAAVEQPVFAVTVLRRTAPTLGIEAFAYNR